MSIFVLIPKSPQCGQGSLLALFRWRRDKAVNSKKYTRVNTAVGDLEKVASADIKVGDVLQVREEFYGA